VDDLKLGKYVRAYLSDGRSVPRVENWWLPDPRQRNIRRSQQPACTYRRVCSARKGCSSAAFGRWRHSATPTSYDAWRNVADGSAYVAVSTTTSHSL